MEPNPVFAPVLAAGNQFELLLKQRMVRVNYSERLVLNVTMRRILQTHSNAHAERWVRSIKEECLSKLILFGETSLRRVVSEFLEHYHLERNHQGKNNLLLFPVSASREPNLRGAIRCRERLGGLLNYYTRAA